MKWPIVLSASLLIIAIVIIEGLVFSHTYRFPHVNFTFLVSTYSLTHWFAFVGTVYIFLVSPVQPVIKRVAPRHFNTMLSIHMIGNLSAILLISIHFAQQLTRPANSFPNLGTGVILYASMILLVATGLMRYLGLSKKLNGLYFLHTAIALTFYLVIIVHILHGLSII